MTTPLGLAIRYDHIDAVRLLLEYGANPISDIYYINIYHVLSSNNADMFRLLISYGMPPERNLPTGRINIDNMLKKRFQYVGLKIIYEIYA